MIREAVTLVRGVGKVCSGYMTFNLRTNNEKEPESGQVEKNPSGQKEWQVQILFRRSRLAAPEGLNEGY